MRYSLFFSSLLIGLFYTVPCHGQTISSTIKGRSIDFYLNVAGLYNINQPDLLPGNTNMHVQNTLGTRVGIEFMLTGRSGIILTTGLDFKLTPQRLYLDYNTQDFGYTAPGKTIQKDINYNVYSIDWKIELGYAIPAGKTSFVDVGMGLVADAAVQANKQEKGEAVYDLVGNNDERGLLMYEYIGWGSHKKNGSGGVTTGLSFLLELKADYRLKDVHLFGKRDIKAGIDISGLAGGNRNNRVELSYYGANRNKYGTDYFIDRQFALGFFIGMQL